MPSSDFVPNNVWASAAPSGHEEEVTTPSGQTCRARRMSIETMISSGMLAESDALTAQISKYTKKVKTGQGAGKPPVITDQIDETALLRDGDATKAMITLIDRALPQIVVSPVVRLHYTERKVGKTIVSKMIPIEERETGIVYTDQIAFEDKFFLFDWAAGGLGSMLSFRQ